MKFPIVHYLSDETDPDRMPPFSEPGDVKESEDEGSFDDTEDEEDEGDSSSDSDDDDEDDSSFDEDDEDEDDTDSNEEVMEPENPNPPIE